MAEKAQGLRQQLREPRRSWASGAGMRHRHCFPDMLAMRYTSTEQALPREHMGLFYIRELDAS